MPKLALPRVRLAGTLLGLPNEVFPFDENN
jgi:hypothetical protein